MAKSRWLTVLLLLLLAPPAAGHMGPEGAERFSFGAWFTEAPKPGGSARLRITMRGDYADTTVGVARIVLPPGVQLLGGDTLHRAHPARPEAEWEILIRPLIPGQQEIRGILWINDSGCIDEGEFVMPLNVRADTILGRQSTMVRTERVSGAQRYRYGGGYMVPIDGPEALMQDDINRGTKPKILKRGAAVDSLGRIPSPMRVPFVVFIDPAGRLRDARPLGGIDRNSYLVGLARAALQHWTFAPAVAKGRNVSDWLEVKVDVLPQK